MKPKILQVIGSRPNLVKFINITGHDKVVWTGQHWDEDLKCRQIQKPDYNLGETQLHGMVQKITEIIKKEKPDCLLLYGDTRSALAGACSAHETNTRVAHIEAGLRCGNMDRPEERIRKMIDHISTWLFCPTETARQNLLEENIKGKVFLVGDIHYQRYLENRTHLGHILVTLHRAENVDNKERLKEIINSLDGKEKIIFPLHPRTKKKLKEFGIKVPNNVKLIEPVKYEDMMFLVRDAKMVVTDSGGVSRESFFAGAPVTVIGDSEWPEIHCFGDGSTEEKIRSILWEELK